MGQTELDRYSYFCEDKGISLVDRESCIEYPENRRWCHEVLEVVFDRRCIGFCTAVGHGSGISMGRDPGFLRVLSQHGARAADMADKQSSTVCLY